VKSTGLLLASILLVTSSLSAHAAFDGKQLLEQCSIVVEVAEGKAHKGSPVEAAYNGGFCTGFVQGIIYTSIVYERPRGNVRVCVPDNLTNLQAAQVLVRYLKQQEQEFPAMLKLSANTLAIAALHSEYSCPRAGL
jgi:hypothetical protein